MARDPQRVVDVTTSVPAFVGYTEKAWREHDGDLTLVPTRVRSLEELGSWFGLPHADPIALRIADRGDGGFDLLSVVAPAVPSFLLHHAVRSFFANGGGPCHVVSVGGYSTPVALGGSPGAHGLLDGLQALAGADEPALVAIPDAVALDPDDYASLARATLAHCSAWRHRFAILDVRDGLMPLDAAQLAASRALFGEERLASGAAYYPFLRVGLAPTVHEDEARRTSNVQVTLVSASGEEVTISLVELRLGDGPALPDLEAYRFALRALEERGIVLPPSGAVAGVYAATDRTRGVWKAPANVALAERASPVVALDDTGWDRLSAVDPADGRSINPIRAFAGRGTLVWGSRTLAGNDEERRFVPVRRLLGAIAESAERSTRWAAFEPNTPITWAGVRATVEDYLVRKWREGALAGVTPDDAFYVSCGLGETMTSEDLAAGRLIVEIGVAPLRAAEFIVLRFAHSTRTD